MPQKAAANSFQVLTTSLGFLSVGEEQMGLDRFLNSLGISCYYGTIFLLNNLVYFTLHKYSIRLLPVLFVSSFPHIFMTMVCFNAEITGRGIALPQCCGFPALLCCFCQCCCVFPPRPIPVFLLPSFIHCNGKKSFLTFCCKETCNTSEHTWLRIWGYGRRKLWAACQIYFQVHHFKGHHLSVTNYHSAVKSTEHLFTCLDTCLWPEATTPVS